MNNRKQNKQPIFAEVKTIDDNQRAMGRAAKLHIIFESAMTDFTEQLRCADMQISDDLLGG